MSSADRIQLIIAESYLKSLNLDNLTQLKTVMLSSHLPQAAQICLVWCEKTVNKMWGKSWHSTKVLSTLQTKNILDHLRLRSHLSCTSFGLDQENRSIGTFDFWSISCTCGLVTNEPRAVNMESFILTGKPFTGRFWWCHLASSALDPSE